MGAQSVKNGLPPGLESEARLKIEQVSTLTGWGRSKIYKELAEQRFPAPERRGARCSRWRAGDVLEWLANGSQPGPRDAQANKGAK